MISFVFFREGNNEKEKSADIPIYQNLGSAHEKSFNNTPQRPPGSLQALLQNEWEYKGGALFGYEVGSARCLAQITRI
jgi:hypothetical protein